MTDLTSSYDPARPIEDFEPSKTNPRTHFPDAYIADLANTIGDKGVLGVVAAGDHRGDGLEVCIAREKCDTHWGKEIKERAKTEKLRSSGKTKTAAAREQRSAQRELAERAARDARWNHFAPAIKKAVHAAVAKLPAGLPKAVYAQMLASHRLPAKTKLAQLAKALLEQAVRNEFDRHMWHGNEKTYVAWAKVLGVDVKACEPPAAAKASKKKAS